MNTKTCKTCNQEKPIADFSRNTKEGNFNHTPNSSYKAQCKVCCSLYAKAWRKKNKGYRGSGKLSKYPKEEMLLLSVIRRKLNEAIGRMKKYGKEVSDLDTDYLYQLYKQQGGKCAYSGAVLQTEKHSFTMLSLDQIEPSKGYLKGNVQWLAWAVNRAKGDLPEDLFLDMCRVITEKCND